MKPENLGYVDELLGLWEVRYPGADGMIVEDHVERLELRIGGTFAWDPTPLWAKQGGRWGITVDDKSRHIRLYFQERNGGTYRGNWLVLATLPLGGHSVVMLHWQRTFADAVVFDDRVLVARQVAGEGPPPFVGNSSASPSGSR